MPQADVVVVTFNSREHVRACVEPLCRDERISVTVVDNNSADGTLNALADLPARTIPRPDNRGFAHACNIGWRAGESPTVVFLNPDARAEPDAILALGEHLRAHPSVGALGPQIVDEEDGLQFSQRRFATAAISLASAFFLPRIWPTTPWSLDVAEPARYRVPGAPDWLSGACLAVRRELLERLGGFDERFFMYYEDMDLCRRIRDAGFDVRYEPSIHVVHIGGASAPRARLIPVMTESQLLYAAKHGGRRREIGERLTATLHALTHLGLTTQGAEGRRGYMRALSTALRGLPAQPPGGRGSAAPSGSD